MEIKRTSLPNIKYIKSFKVLANYFSTAEITEGGVVCTADSLFPLGQGNKIIPVNYI